MVNSDMIWVVFIFMLLVIWVATVMTLWMIGASMS